MSEEVRPTVLRFWQDVWFVAAYELGEAMRTRLFQLGVLAYLGALGLGNWALVKVLKEAETTMALSLGVPSTEKPGAMVGELVRRGELVDLIAPLVGGRENAGVLLGEPILGLWAGAISMAILPTLLSFTASGSIAGEVRSRSIRYLACRTGRLQIGLGKLAGQLALAAVAAALGIVLTIGMSQTLMVSVPLVPLAGSLVMRTLHACAYALPWGGLALAVSGAVPSPNGARFATGVLLIGMHICSTWASFYVDDTLVGRLADLFRLFCANTTWADFWSTQPDVLAGATGRCLILAVVYYTAGHLRFGTRDL